MKNITKKNWGQYILINKTVSTVTKELIIKPGGCLSYQKHKGRSELWLIAEGNIDLIINDIPIFLKQFSTILIPHGTWHTAYVKHKNQPVKVIQIWMNTNGLLDESDIERKKLPSFCTMHRGWNGV